jgi:hypothetical protein
MPAQEAGKIVADECLLRPVQAVKVIGDGGLAPQRQPSRHIDGQEIPDQRFAASIGDPSAGDAEPKQQSAIAQRNADGGGAGEPWEEGPGAGPCPVRRGPGRLHGVPLAAMTARCLFSRHAILPRSQARLDGRAAARVCRIVAASSRRAAGTSRFVGMRAADAACEGAARAPSPETRESGCYWRKASCFDTLSMRIFVYASPWLVEG